MEPHWGAVIVAAGRSERFGGIDKTLADLRGRPVLARSIEAILSDTRVRALVVVGSALNLDACRQLIAEARRPDLEVAACIGGNTRSQSVRAGLDALPASVTHVAVHDAARALVPAEVVSAVLDAAEQTGAAVPVMPVASTLLLVGEDGLVGGTLDREAVREAQTPQAARRDLLDAAMRAHPNETDESTALHRAGYPVALVPGSRANIKITVPDDIRLAAALLAIELEAH